MKYALLLLTITMLLATAPAASAQKVGNFILPAHAGNNSDKAQAVAIKHDVDSFSSARGKAEEFGVDKSERTEAVSPNYNIQDYIETYHNYY